MRSPNEQALHDPLSLRKTGDHSGRLIGEGADIAVEGWEDGDNNGFGIVLRERVAVLGGEVGADFEMENRIMVFRLIGFWKDWMMVVTGDSGTLKGSCREDEEGTLRIPGGLK